MPERNCCACCVYGSATGIPILFILVAWILTTISSFGCNFASVPAPNNGRFKVGFFSSENASVFRDKNRFFCVPWDTAAKNEFDNKWNFGRDTGHVLNILGIVMFFTFCILGCCMRCRPMVVKSLGFLLIIMAVFSMLLLLALKSHFCEYVCEEVMIHQNVFDNGACEEGCSLSRGGILAIVAGVLYFLAGVMTFFLKDRADERMPTSPALARQAAAEAQAQAQAQAAAQAQAESAMEAPVPTAPTAAAVDASLPRIARTEVTNPDGTITRTIVKTTPNPDGSATIEETVETITPGVDQSSLLTPLLPSK